MTNVYFIVDAVEAAQAGAENLPSMASFYLTIVAWIACLVVAAQFTVPHRLLKLTRLRLLA